MKEKLEKLKEVLEGELLDDSLNKTLYSTDASVYREIPLAVAKPKTIGDIKQLVSFAKSNNIGLIPRAAGTSLAGQVVGDGIVVDVSYYMNKIVEIDPLKKEATIQPGVVRDELNHYLKQYGLFFSPITSTANRAMIGGMVGNNSCGTNSIVYGSTRDKIISLQMVCEDGEVVTFKSQSIESIKKYAESKSTEGKVYQWIMRLLEDQDNARIIEKGFPASTVSRRNTGYALDDLWEQIEEKHINIARLICGAEGTLGIITEIKVKLDKLPPENKAVVAIHCKSIHEAMISTQVSMNHEPYGCELMDKVILDCTNSSSMYRPLRAFVEDDPAAILMVEFRDVNEDGLQQKCDLLINELERKELGYSYPILYGKKSEEAWKLRAAGLGLLANVPGDKKAVACIEDTSVSIEVLPQYIEDFEKLMNRFGQKVVYYAHAGAGELHLRPLLNLKDKNEIKDFYEISKASAKLVKKYNGSLSGEHGDGRVRAPFIELVMGKEVNDLFRSVKAAFDPDNIFNPGKIVYPKAMTEDLRDQPSDIEKKIKTIYNFNKEGGFLRAAEKCNGSGDCRKLPLSGGTMCPSYRATRNEKDTTRGRANMLRELMINSTKNDPFAEADLKETMDLCLSCKGCTSECPSNVNMTVLKSEFLHQYYQSHRRPISDYFFTYYDKLAGMGSKFRGFSNLMTQHKITAALLKKIIGIAPQRSIPQLSKDNVFHWFKKKGKYLQPMKPHQKVYLFCDEFINRGEAHIGITAIRLLQKIGIYVELISHPESARAALSKGMLPYAKKIALKQVLLFGQLINQDVPLVGIEPSAILSFKDEYPRLVDGELIEMAEVLSKNTYTIEEFLYSLCNQGIIHEDMFKDDIQQILIHGHCHQKALTDISKTAYILSIPKGFSAQLLDTGCCGMAGSFGYEKQHYELSMKIGGISLFPAIKNAPENSILVASGTSCRHQIKEGTNKHAYHSIEVLYKALKIK